jgi:hypothetical protein
VTKSTSLSVIAVTWLLAILVSYYYYNADYYVEKLSTFLGFLGRALR